MGLGGYFVYIGLDRASKLAGVIGAFAELVGLSLSVCSLLLARRAPSAALVSPAVEGSQVVSGGTIGGDNIQIGKARDVDIHRGEGE